MTAPVHDGEENVRSRADVLLSGLNVGRLPNGKHFNSNVKAVIAFARWYALRRERLSAPKLSVDGWQPIETALKDGNPLILCFAGLTIADAYGLTDADEFRGGKAPQPMFLHKSAPLCYEGHWWNSGGAQGSDWYSNNRFCFLKKPTHWMPPLKSPRAIIDRLSLTAAPTGEPTKREWLVIQSSQENAVFAGPEAAAKGYIPRDEAERLLGRDLGGTVWFTKDESAKMRAHPSFTTMCPEPTPAPVAERQKIADILIGADVGFNDERLKIADAILALLTRG